MSISKGIIEWFKTCPGVGKADKLDVNQTDERSIGLYKQPSVTVEPLIDGGEIRTENYYLLFTKDAQLSTDRLSNEDFLENVEKWISDQELKENYPKVGYPVYWLGSSNSYYMLRREENEAVYQITIQIKYERTV